MSINFWGDETPAMKDLRAKCDAAIERIVKEHSLAIEALTEKQIVELLKQVFASGDIIRQTVVYTEAQSVVYIPFAEKELLSRKLLEIRNLCMDQGHYTSGRPSCDCLECRLKRRVLELL